MEVSGNNVLDYFGSGSNMFNFWLECVRQGRADIIQNYRDEKEKKICFKVTKITSETGRMPCGYAW